MPLHLEHATMLNALLHVAGVQMKLSLSPADEIERLIHGQT